MVAVALVRYESYDRWSTRTWLSWTRFAPSITLSPTILGQYYGTSTVRGQVHDTEHPVPVLNFSPSSLFQADECGQGLVSSPIDWVT